MITPERQQIIRASLHANNAEEAAFLRAEIKRTGLDQLFPPPPARPARNDHDWEGAILARQSADQI